MIALLVAGLAWADPCAAAEDGMPVGPVQTGLVDGDLGLARRVCTRSEVGLGGGAYLLAEPENFYGYLHGEAVLAGSFALSEDTEVFLRLEPVRWQTVLGALPSDHVGLGFTSLGASQRIAVADRWALAFNGRAVLPTAIGLYRNALPFGLDLGIAGTWAASERVEVHGQLSALGSTMVSQGPALARAALVPTVGTSWRPGRALALVLDLTGSFGRTAPLDHLAAAVGVRVAAGDHLGFELGTVVPVAGRERGLAAVELGGAWRF